MAGLYVGVTYLWWSAYYLIDTRSILGALFGGAYTTIAAIFYFGVTSVVVAVLWLRYVYLSRRIPLYVSLIAGPLGVFLPLLLIPGAPTDQLALQACAQVIFMGALAVGFARQRNRDEAGRHGGAGASIRPG